MNKIGLITQEEYLRRVSKPSFLFLTLLMPFLLAAIVFVPLWLSSFQGDETRTVAIIDKTGKYVPLFEDTKSYRFIRDERETDEQHRRIPSEEIFAFLFIQEDLSEKPEAATLYSKQQIPEELSRLVDQTLKRQIERDKLANYHLPDLEKILRESQVDFHVRTVKWNDDGSESHSSSILVSITGGLFTMLIYMFIMIYGAMVMQGVTEEKTSRIVEVLVSSVKPFDLMMGKIIGIGLVGLTQVFLWAIMTSFLLLLGGIFLPESDVASAGPLALNGQVSQDEWLEILRSVDLTAIGILFILYFIGGYLLYSALFAAIGSATDSPEDTQQFMLPISLLLVFALYAGIYSMDNPDGPLAFWCSMIPFTAPIVMMVRTPFDIPLWQQILSLGLLYATAISSVWLSAKIYRVGILMYGKKASLGEIWRWIRYK